MQTSNEPLGLLAVDALFGPPSGRGAIMAKIEKTASTIVTDCEKHIAEVYRSSISTSSGVVLRNSAAFKRLRAVCEMPTTLYPLLGLLCGFTQAGDGDTDTPPTLTPWCSTLVQTAGRLCHASGVVGPASVPYDVCAGMHRAIVQLLCNGILVYQCAGPLESGILGGREEGGSPPIYALLRALCECLGDHHPSAPRMGQLIRTLAKLPAVCRAAFEAPLGYSSSVICCLLRGSTHTRSTIQLAETSGCIGTFFIRAKEVASLFILAHFEPYVVDLQAALGMGGKVGGGDYVSCRLCLKLLSYVLGDGGFGKARTRLADCPALLAAVLGAVEEVRLTPHPTSPVRGPVTGDTLLLYDAYHVLKVFVAKPKKNLPVRCLISTNRDSLVHFINTYHACCPLLEGAKGMGDYEEERNLLVERVISIDPLTADELLELDSLFCEHSYT